MSWQEVSKRIRENSHYGREGMNTEWLVYVRNKITVHTCLDDLTLKIRNDTITLYGKDSFNFNGIAFDIESYNVGAYSLVLVGARRGMIFTLRIYYSEITSVS